MNTSPTLPPDRIGQIAVPVDDVERATAFYRDVLGLTHLFTAPPGLSFFRCGEVRIMLDLPARQAGAAGPLLYYTVRDVRSAHGRLLELGAREVAPPHVIHRTETMELWMAFFEDSEKNTFAVMSEVATTRGG